MNDDDETRELQAHWWKDSDEGPYNCVILVPDGGWTTVQFRAYEWRTLLKVMRRFGVERGNMRERDVAVNETEAIARSMHKHRPVELSA